MPGSSFRSITLAVLFGEVTRDGNDILLLVTPDEDHWAKQEIATSLATITPLLRKPVIPGVANPDALLVPCTWATVTQVAAQMRELPHQWQPGPRLCEWIVAEVGRRAAATDLLARVETDRVPMGHQADGAFAIGMMQRYFLADEMGTGKSMTALLGLRELELRGRDPWPAVIVCPASVIDPWLEEIEVCFPSWSVLPFRGPKRHDLSNRAQLYVMSYNVLRTDHTDLGGNRSKLTRFFAPVPRARDNRHVRSLVVDEAHAMCNDSSRQSGAVRRLSRIAENFIEMSGTPITGDVGGFWPAVYAIDPMGFPSHERYKQRYAKSSPRRGRGGDYEDKIDGLRADHAAEFHTVMRGAMRRVAKADVLTDLPEKTYSTRIIEVPAAYRAAYDEMEQDMIAHIPDTIEPLEVMSILAQLQRLAQLASSACDVEHYEELDEKPDSETYMQMIPKIRVTMREPCWKVDELMRVLDDAGGSPIVTFAPSRQLMDLAGRRAAGAGYRVGYIVGGQAPRVRTANRLGFQNGEFDLLCVTTDAGGVGITLTRSHTAVFLQRPWALWQAAQAEDRLHRRGQEEPVHIIDVVATNTIESRVRMALKDKASQLAELVRDPRIVRGLLGGQPLRV